MIYDSALSLYYQLLLLIVVWSANPLILKGFEKKQLLVVSEFASRQEMQQQSHSLDFLLLCPKTNLFQETVQ